MIGPMHKKGQKLKENVKRLLTSMVHYAVQAEITTS